MLGTLIFVLDPLRSMEGALAPVCLAAQRAVPWSSTYGRGWLSKHGGGAVGGAVGGENQLITCRGNEASGNHLRSTTAAQVINE